MNIYFLKLVNSFGIFDITTISCIVSDVSIATLIAAYDNKVKSVSSYRVFNSLRYSLNILYENSE